MRTLPTGLAAHLASGATTLCRCWRITRADGVVQGFTDHDEDLAFDATTFHAGTGFEGTEIEAKLGMSVGGSEIHGALSSDALLEADLAAGRYDAARVELFLADWGNVENRLLLRVGDIGEVRREGPAFAAEVRSLSQRLDEERGRVFAAGCDADLGDARCTVDLTDAAFHGAGTVAALQGIALVTVGGLDAFEDDWFTRGRLTWTSGANMGLAVEVKEHRVDAGEVTLSLWQLAPEPIAAGDEFAVTAGCDKRFDTCRAKFANTLNFRGFPQMPGDDFVVAYAVPGEPTGGGGVTG